MDFRNWVFLVDLFRNMSYSGDYELVRKLVEPEPLPEPPVDDWYLEWVDE